MFNPPSMPGNNRMTAAPSPTKLYAWTYSAAAVGVLLWVACTFLADPGINNNPHAAFPDMVYGKADRPFVYRTLLPSTIRGICALIPASTRRSMVSSLRYDLNHGRWEKEYLPEYAAAILLEILCLIGFYVSLRYLCAALYDVPPVVVDLLSLAGVAALPVFFVYSNYLYDLPTLFLTTLCLGLMAHGRWSAYAAAFFFACVNKETAILLTALFVLNQFTGVSTLPRGSFLRLLALQIAVFAAVKGSLWLIFRGNPGSVVEFHMLDHNLGLARHVALPTFLSWTGVVFLVGAGWRENPLFLRNALWMLVPLVILTGFLGFLDELRDYYEVYPVVLLLVLPTALRTAGILAGHSGAARVP